jgi:hypothetical protein
MLGKAVTLLLQVTTCLSASGEHGVGFRAIDEHEHIMVLTGK